MTGRPSAPPVRLHTRDRLLVEAARLFAMRGFHGTSIDDLGAAAGISGPTVYRHFSSKDEVLAELLVGIGQRMLEEGRRIVASAPTRVDALRDLIARHAAFAAAEPHLIRVHDRDLDNLSEAEADKVRSRQRAYTDLWVEALRDVRPELTRRQAQIEVQGVFGLLNSTKYSQVGPAARDRLSAMAERALLL